ncbi:hypothetical protein ACTXQV_52785, partial [Klebsiella pneumoniae]
HLTERHIAMKKTRYTEEQDAFGVESHRRAWAATQEGRFKNEIIGVEGHDANGFKILCDIDEVIRPDANLEAFKALKPVFDPKGGSSQQLLKMMGYGV